jgi:4-aminobutyrate aminotransferase-like enzyme
MIRLLPPLNISDQELALAMQIITEAVQEFQSS